MVRGKAQQPSNESQYEFSDMPAPKPRAPKIKPLREAIWTENKAKLIERYLYYFVMITKHGSYFDGFAGPQQVGKPESWAANLVLELEPKWIRHFYFFDKGKRQIAALKRLKVNHRGRDIRIQRGDFNRLVLKLLASGKVRQKEATFCLLDQRTFECRWSTLDALAKYKTSGNKIELFYFLPQHWLARALKAQKDESVVARWWGRDDWPKLRNMKAEEVRAEVVKRFQNELGYSYVAPWPIYMRKRGKRIMYYMIHASDHQDAPKLMRRAYERAVKPKEPIGQQLGLELAITS